MRKIWEQMQGNEFKCRHERVLLKRQRKRNITITQRAANRAVRRMAEGKEPDMDRWAAEQLMQRVERRDKQDREREAFRTLRKLGLLCE